MNEFEGKTAVISGGAEGIGLGIALALGEQGMNVVLADVDAGQLRLAEEKLLDRNIPVLALTMDVTDVVQWQSLAKQAIERFGKVHMLVNNAGVGGRPGELDKTSIEDWNWLLDVNLMGVVYGTQTMIPLMKRQGEGGWLINVASMAGLGGLPFAGPYTATKFAVVGMSESWHAELAPHNIHVSVLCPGFVKTRINLSQRNRPSQYEGSGPAQQTSTADTGIAEQMQQVIDNGLCPEVVGRRVVEALTGNELYIFTHPNFRALVQKRYASIDAAFERSESSPLLASILNEPMPDFG